MDMDFQNIDADLMWILMRFLTWILTLIFLKASPMKLGPHQICIQSMSNYLDTNGCGFGIDFQLCIDFNGKFQHRIHVKKWHLFFWWHGLTNRILTKINGMWISSGFLCGIGCRFHMESVSNSMSKSILWTYPNTYFQALSRGELMHIGPLVAAQNTCKRGGMKDRCQSCLAAGYQCPPWTE